MFSLSNLTRAMCFGLASLFVRQFGHAVLEPPCHDKEALLLGFNTRNKTLIVLGYLLLPPSPGAGWFLDARRSHRDDCRSGTAVVSWTMAVVLGRVAYLMWAHNFRMAMIWFVKLVTDPLTDIVAYCSSPFSASKALLPSQARKAPPSEPVGLARGGSVTEPGAPMLRVDLACSRGLSRLVRPSGSGVCWNAGRCRPEALLWL